MLLRIVSVGDLIGDVRGEIYDFDLGVFLSRINCMLFILIINVIFSYYFFEILGFVRWLYLVLCFFGLSGR